MAGAVLPWFLDRLVVVAGALDDAGVAALAAGVELLRAGDLGHDAVQDALPLVRGKAGLGLPVSGVPADFDQYGIVHFDLGAVGGQADSDAEPPTSVTNDAPQDRHERAVGAKAPGCWPGRGNRTVNSTAVAG